MKVMFIEPPPFIDWLSDSSVTTAGRRHPSKNVTGEKVYSYLNLSSASVLRKSGHSVIYSHCQTMDLDLNLLKEKINKENPNLIVIMFEHITISISNKIMKFAKELGIKTLYVGPLITATYKSVLKDKFVDFAIRGEWDYAVLELAECLQNNTNLEDIKGLSFIKENKLVINPKRDFIQNLDELPIPAYDLIDISKFYESVFTSFPAATIISSRGCPFNCIYCVFPNTIYSHAFRAQSPERVLKEALVLQNEFGVKEVRYDDDNFDVDEERVIEICRLFKDNGIKFRWMIQSRPGDMTERKAKVLKSAGCSMVLYGIESGNDEVLKKIRKSATKESLRRGVRIAHKYGLDILNCVMLGFYWDTEETVNESIDFAFELNAEFTQFSIPTPLPGTDYYDLLKEKGYILSEDLEKGDSFHAANVNFPNLSKEFLDKNLKDIYRRYYIRPAYIFRMMFRLVRRPSTVPQFLRLVVAYLKRFRMGW